MERGLRTEKTIRAVTGPATVTGARKSVITTALVAVLSHHHGIPPMEVVVVDKLTFKERVETGISTVSPLISELCGQRINTTVLREMNR